MMKIQWLEKLIVIVCIIDGGQQRGRRLSLDSGATEEKVCIIVSCFKRGDEPGVLERDQIKQRRYKPGLGVEYNLQSSGIGFS